MKKTLLAFLLSFSTLLMAESSSNTGTFTPPSSDMLKQTSFAIGAAQDYGIGVSMQFNKLLDVSVGGAGIGADYIFYRYSFMPNSKFFSKRPLNFYAGGGLGYVWDDKYSNMKKGFILRMPVGANWRFAKEWSVYLSAAPALNIQQETNVTNKGNKFLLVGTIGIRYLF